MALGECLARTIQMWVRESDVRADPDYKRKQEFFEALRLKGIMA